MTRDLLIMLTCKTYSFCGCLELLYRSLKSILCLALDTRFSSFIQICSLWIRRRCLKVHHLASAKWQVIRGSFQILYWSILSLLLQLLLLWGFLFVFKLKILSANTAETSITVNYVGFVIDSGKMKEVR